ncbi:MAG: hypothetical protein J6Y07_04575 [Alphaproteobacteria bacterium]|nr:hypothetical protein [Alphaproteobacteria bacterium]
MPENYGAKDCLTATDYAKNKGLDLDTVKKAIKKAESLVVMHAGHQVNIIIRTGSKRNSPRIHPCTEAQAKFMEIIKKLQKEKQ